MKVKLMFLASLFLLMGCSTQWKNTRTGIIKEGVPQYIECNKDVPDIRLDTSCYIQCNDAYKKKYGKLTYAMSSQCNDQCEKNYGTKKEADQKCNEDKAKADNWVKLE
jgi:hypothetical protein